MTTGERVKKIRKDQKMTLEQFGEKCGVGKTTICKIERGERGLTNQMVTSICREFAVNKEWLENGNGEMCVPQTAFDLGEFARQRGLSPLEEAIIKAYFEIPADQRQRAVRKFEQFYAQQTEYLQDRYPASSADLDAADVSDAG